MNQTLHTSEVHKDAKLSHIRDSARYQFARFQLLEKLLAAALACQGSPL